MCNLFNLRHAGNILVIALFLFSATACRAGILTQNSLTATDNDATFNAWLTDIGITSDHVEYRVDFETGFTDGQNVSGVSGLFPGGMVITDTSGTYGAMIRGSTSYFGGSRPVGLLALSHNETAYLVLDFTERPVDYISFQDIDHSGTTIYVEFTDNTTSSFGIETTATGGDSAEFTGIYRNDMPRIQRIRLDATGDGRWGIDNIRYGRLPEPCFVDLQDFSDFASQWLMAGTSLSADFDASGEVNLADMEIFLDSWLMDCPSGWPLG